MAQSRALLVQGEQITNTERVVTSALGAMVWVSLPKVDDGTGVTVDDGFDITIFANSTGAIEVLDANGNRVVIVSGFTEVTLRSRDNTRNPWEVGYDEKGKTIADLSVTDPSTAAVDAAAFFATYVEATVESEVDAAIAVPMAVLETALAVAFAEMELKVNWAIQAVSGLAVSGLADQSEGTDTLALADNEDWQVVDDSERTVTSARSRTTRATLPLITSAGATTTVGPAHTVRFTSTSDSGIEIRDYRHKFVGFCPPRQSVTVRASTVDPQQWHFLGTVSESNAKVPSPKVPPLSVVMPTGAAGASNFASAYTNDATFNTALDVAVDAAFDGLDLTTATAFTKIEVTLNALLVSLEVPDVVAVA